MKNYYAMILAGGGGTRLWPMSRRSTPKQLLPLTGEKTMFQISVERLHPLFKPEQIYIVTGQAYVEEMKASVPEIPAENFIVEPYGRDSAAATALGLAVIHKRDPQATVAILTADHHISKREKFREVLNMSYDVAQEDRIITLGISPTYPSTGFGYIHQGRKLKQLRGFICYESLGFKEKPNIVTATSFLADGNYTWNSGMFIWKTATAFAEFERQQPEMYRLIEQLIPSIDTSEYESTLAEIWDKIPKTSIDFAIMEGAKNISVIPVEIGWSDVGSWASLFGVLRLDQFGNSFKGESPHRVILDTHNTLVFSDRLVVTIGIENLVIVDTDDAILICNKERTQDVKEVVNHLKATNRDEYL